MATLRIALRDVRGDSWWIAGNLKPAIRNIDEAVKRRLHLIPFTVTILPVTRGGRLTEKLLAERDGILA